MAKNESTSIKYPQIAVCGLSCRLCTSYHRETKSRCPGCKTDFRMGAACAIVNCAIKKMHVEFCWDCPENADCVRFNNHKEFSRTRDTSTCYQKVEANVEFIQKRGIAEFEKDQKQRELLLKDMLKDFNEGRSKIGFSIAATIMTTDELKGALSKANFESRGMDIKDRSKVLHAILDSIAQDKGYVLRLRK